ncbi:MAG: transcriptional regulator [Crocinitomicaceae bacterium]|nr:transcriptional regulator [Crocinitomicaceae bacterium]
MPLNKPIEKRYFTITEVANELGLNASQLRYWEKEFAPLSPRTNARGKRFYTASDKELIQQIAWLVKGQGYTIDGARKALQKRKDVAAEMAAEASSSIETGVEKDQLLERLYSVKAKLDALSERLAES